MDRALFGTGMLQLEKNLCTDFFYYKDIEDIEFLPTL